MESMPTEIRFKQTTKEDPHAAMWEDGSGARPEEAVPKGRQDVTRRAPAAGVFPFCSSEQVAKALSRRSLVRENDKYRRSGRAASTSSNGETMLILPFRWRAGWRQITDQ